MKAILKHVLALAGLAIATQAAAQITFYEHPGFRGESFIIHQSIGNLQGVNNNRASSAVVRGEAWEICDAPGFGGRCVILRPGEYPSLGTLGMNDNVSSVRREAERIARVDPPVVAPGPAHITLYGRENFQGRTFTADRPIGSLERADFDDRASSAVVTGGAWEVCEENRFGGRCVTLRPGRYPSLAAMGMDNNVSSLRLAGSAPPPVAAQITFYGRENFEGRAINVDRPVGDLERLGFADRASSAVVKGGPWEVCDDVGFGGRCMILRPGDYPSLATIGMDNRIASVRRVDSARVDARPDRRRD